MATALELMTTSVITVAPTASAREALRALGEGDVRHLPVLDERRELVGMVSDRDLLRLRGHDLSRPVSEVMSADVISVSPAAELEEIIELMTENRVGAVPVVDADFHLAGIVSYVDVLRAAARVLRE